MKRRTSEFPWYLFYVPLFTFLVIVWCLAGITEDMSMGVFEHFLEWMGMNGQLVTSIIIICAAIFALIYIIVRWFSTNKKLQNIEAVANTAPASLEKTIQNSEAKICEKINDQDKNLIASLTEIKSSTGAMQRQFENLNMYRANSPVQMNALVAAIIKMYDQHDQDQETIDLLKREILELKQRNQNLEDQLQQIKTPNKNRRRTYEPSL